MKEIFNFIDEHSIITEVLSALIIVAITNVVATIINKWFKSKEVDNINIKFMHSIIKYGIWILGLFIACGQFPALKHVSSTLLASSGVIALIVSLAAQESFSNIFSGLMISLFRPFNIGDRVHLLSSNITGYIETITVRHTIIRTFTNSRIVVPNSVMSKEVIENSDIIESDASSFLDVSVSYECDLHKAIEIIQEVIYNHPLYIDHRTEEQIKENVEPVKVFVRDFGDSGIALRASVWTKTVNENFQACSDCRIRIKEQFELNGIEIPYNKIQIVK